MKKEYIIDNLQNSKKKYRSELLDFIHFYIKAVEKLHCKVFEKGCSDREKYLIKRLEYWLEESGYILFSDTIQHNNQPDIDKPPPKKLPTHTQYLLSVFSQSPSVFCQYNMISHSQIPRYKQRTLSL